MILVAFIKREVAKVNHIFPSFEKKNGGENIYISRISPNYILLKRISPILISVLKLAFINFTIAVNNVSFKSLAGGRINKKKNITIGCF